MQTLVFGWLANPDSTYDELAQTATSIGISVTPQAIEQRFGEPAEQVLTACPQAIELLSRFNGVYLQQNSEDSSV